VVPLHITNGDCAADTLRTFLTDRVLITCDVLYEGPAPLVSDAEWYDTRARFLADGFGTGYEKTRSELERFDRTITGVPHLQEVVLWFEHDLFDQLLLIRTLDMLARLKPHVTLICIDRFPGVERFIGLGQLSADQLATLYPAREPVTAEQFALASEAWRAFRSADPRDLLALLIGLTAVARNNPRERPTLPFLADAIHRLFEEYPSTANGLSRTAHALLRVLADGPIDGQALFESAQAGEPRPFIGDTGFFDAVHRLAAARVPLVTLLAAASPPPARSATIELTAAGRDVLAGRRDAVALNGIDEWRGGVHLFGQDRSPWRWDGQRETLVS
jgi:hypothetical protein